MYFGPSSGKSGFRPYEGNPATSGSGQISIRIYRMLVQLQWVQVITAKRTKLGLTRQHFDVVENLTSISVSSNHRPTRKAVHVQHKTEENEFA